MRTVQTLAIVFVAVLMPMTVAASECVCGTDTVVEAQYLDNEGLPVNNGTLYLTVWNSTAGFEGTNTSMSAVGSRGLYNATVTCPNATGLYLLEIRTSDGTGWGSGDLLAVSAETNPLQFEFWYLIIVGVLLALFWYTKSILLGLAAVVTCGVGTWWAGSSSLTDVQRLALIGGLICIAGVVVLVILRQGDFGFSRGGDSE